MSTACHGLEASNVATVTLDVAPVNDAAAAVADSYPVANNTKRRVAAPGVPANDEEIGIGVDVAGQ